MTAASLLANLTFRGVVLTKVDGDIQIQSPKGELTDNDIQIIKDHKPELIDLLTVPSRWGEYHDAIAHAFANPSTREEIGPLWMTEPDGFGPCEFHETTLPGDCDHCGSDQHKDYSIHGGRSIRRDCANCGRFIQWQKWNLPQEDQPR